MKLADIYNELSFFFDDPITAPSQHARNNQCSVLYLLRRELIDTLGYETNSDDEATVKAGGARRRLFASLILMFTMVDLLAKFMSTADKVGARFQEFLRSPDGGGLAPQTGKLFWAARNSLVHAFNIPDGDSLAGLGLAGAAFAQRKIGVTDGGIGYEMIVEGVDDTAIIYVDGVLGIVLKAIENYRNSLLGSGADAERARFKEAFEKYGSIAVFLPTSTTGAPTGKP